MRSPVTVKKDKQSLFTSARCNKKGGKKGREVLVYASVKTLCQLGDKSYTLKIPGVISVTDEIRCLLKPEYQISV